MKTTVLKDVTPRSLIEIDQKFQRYLLPPLLERFPKISEVLKRRSISTRLHYATSQTTVMFIELIAFLQNCSICVIVTGQRYGLTFYCFHFCVSILLMAFIFMHNTITIRS